MQARKASIRSAAATGFSSYLAKLFRNIQELTRAEVEIVSQATTFLHSSGNPLALWRSKPVYPRPPPLRLEHERCRGLQHLRIPSSASASPSAAKICPSTRKHWKKITARCQEAIFNLTPSITLQALQASQNLAQLSGRRGRHGCAALRSLAERDVPDS